MSQTLRLTVLTILFPALLYGCVPVAAGYIAGKSASSGQSIDYYITTERPPQNIAGALQDRRVIVGMDTTEVRLVMERKSPWPENPSRVEAAPDSNIIRWIYERPHDPMRVGSLEAKIAFRNWEVIEVSDTLQ